MQLSTILYWESQAFLFSQSVLRYSEHLIFKLQKDKQEKIIVINSTNMVNIIIYLKEKYDAKELVTTLLKEKLIASASIDLNNVSHTLERNEIIENVFNVITAQSKSLLFNEIVDFVEKRFEEKIPINSIPIIGSNSVFNEIIFNKTLKV